MLTLTAKLQLGGIRLEKFIPVNVKPPKKEKKKRNVII